MRIGELSEITGVSIPTIRAYERDGLIGPAMRTSGKFREFSEQQRNRLDFIKRLRNLGFDLDQVKVLLMLADARPAEKQDVIANQIIAAIELRKLDLNKLERRLSAALSGELSFKGIDDAFCCTP